MSKFLTLLLFARIALSAPALTYSTFLRDSFSPRAIAVDSTGNIYLAGTAVVDPARFQSTVLVMKLNPQATEYLYVRYIGGSVSEAANALAVDSAGNLYVAGITASPDFPVTTGGRLASTPSQTSQRSFVVKLDSAGNVVFSDLLGGTAASSAQALAVNAAGQVLVTGTATSAGFPSTTGAYSVPNTANRPYLLALDPSGSMAFSATGVGGRAIALDPAGSIYVAGMTNQLDYPTTPGVYQPQFPGSLICFNSPCQIPSQALIQYVTKLDPRATTLLYSTAVSGTGNTTNAGLAVDAAGNAYLTGFAGSTYPYTVTPPKLTPNVIGIPGLPFLTKLDPLGQKLVFSIPVGGSGVHVDARGSVFVAGVTGRSGNGFEVPSTFSALANVPPRCLPDGVVSRTSAYVAQVEGASGETVNTHFIGGSGLILTASALRGASLWIAGTTSLPDFPMTENALSIPFFPSSPLPGAYLGSVAFDRAELAVITPRIVCVVDGANMAPAGPFVRSQLLTAFGSNLGPTIGVTAPNNTTTNLGGTTITFGLNAAPILYASDTQVNFGVPEINTSQQTSDFRIARGITGSTWVVPLGFASPSMVLDLAYPPQPNGLSSQIVFALNADGSLNRADNPAPFGSIISVFVNGLQQGRQVALPQLVSNNGWSVVNVVSHNPFLMRVDLRVASPLVNSFSCPSGTGLCTAGFALFDIASVGSQPFGGTVFVRR